MWRDLKGWCNFEDLYLDAVARAQDGDTLVEVGVAFGRSLAFLAREVINSGKRVRIFGIDRWDGTGDGDHADFRAFVKGMREHAGEEFHYVAPIISDSAKAAERFEDGSLAFVFIDAGHEYESVKADIAAWLPKVKPGGILAGHDYHAGDWPGVVRAVHERFGELEPSGDAKYCWRVEVPR